MPHIIMERVHPTAYQLANMLASSELKTLRKLAGLYPHDNCLHDKFYLDKNSTVCDCKKCEKKLNNNKK